MSLQTYKIKVSENTLVEPAIEAAGIEGVVIKGPWLGMYLYKISFIQQTLQNTCHVPEVLGLQKQVRHKS